MADEVQNITGRRVVSVAINDALNVGGSIVTSAARDVQCTAGGSQTDSVGANRSVSVGAADTLSVGGSRTTSISRDARCTVGHNSSQAVGRTLTLTVGDELNIVVGQSSLSLKKDGTIVLRGKDIRIEGSGQIDVRSSRDVVVRGRRVLNN